MSEPILRHKKVTLQIREWSVDALSALIVGFLTSKFPFLLWGPLDRILDHYVDHFLREFINEFIIKKGNDLAITWIMKSDSKKLEKALDLGSRIDRNLKNVPPEKIKEARHEARNAFRKFWRVGRAPM